MRTSLDIFTNLWASSPPKISHMVNIFHSRLLSGFFLIMMVVVLSGSNPCNNSTAPSISLAIADENAPSKSPSPNIIFIVCDQMRGDAIAAAGNSNARTPHIDALAAKGATFHYNFANNPVCLPSRISMFSGLPPSQTGVLCNKHPGEWLSFERSLPWYFQQAGYRTAYIGKNHTFIESELAHFDFTSIRGREEFRAYSKYVPPHWHSDVFWPEKECNPGKNTSDAIKFIEQRKGDEPFFLHISYFDPHPPYMAPAEYTSLYNSEDMILPEYIDPDKLGTRLDQHQRALHYDRISVADLKETMRYYHASVEWGVDHQIGQILQALEDKGITENTILVFTSDHGDFMGEHHMVRKGMFLYDALLHVPMIWYAPGLIEEGLSLDMLTQNLDIFPSLLDFAGIKIPEELAGRSLKNVLQGQSPVDDDFIVYASAAYSDLPEGYWDDPEPYFDPESNVPFHTRVENLTWKPHYKTAMARTREWKLILSESHEPELYHMDGGYIERQNVYGLEQYRAIADKFEQEINAHWVW
jgi:arylsulfatase A-like enzyme